MHHIFKALFVILNIFFFCEGDWGKANANNSHVSNKPERLKIVALGPLSNKQAVLNDPLIPEITQHIQEKYGVDTIILQGSRARGTSTGKSDYNIIALQKSGTPEGHQEFFKDALLDIAIYPKSEAKEAAERYPLAWEEAVVLLQPHHEGEDFIHNLKIAFENTPKKTEQDKKRFIDRLRTNLGRGRENDIREHLYRRKFLHVALVKYFPLHGLTYMGSKKSFEWLKRNDPSAYIAFKEALTPNAGLEKLYNLFTHVTGLKVGTETQLQAHNSHQPKEKYDYSKDPLLPEIVQHIQKNYGASTVILYGSRAQGAASKKSDYDFIAFQKPGLPEQDITSIFKGASLDIHLLSEETTSLIGFVGCTKGAKILTQKNNLGDKFLKNIQDAYDQGFITSNETKQNVIAEIKMKQRKADNKTLEGHDCQNNLLVSILEHYFTLRNLYYSGPSISFKWLKKNDLPVYYAFEKALKPDASLDDLNKLVDLVIGGTVFEGKEEKASLASP